MIKNFSEEIIASLNNFEKDFIYCYLEIVNSGLNSNSPYKFWFNNFKSNFNNRAGDVFDFGFKE